MNKNVATIGEFDLKDAISRTALGCHINEDQAAIIIKSFLLEMENGLAEHGRIEFHDHFSITLRKRKARSGVFKGQAWSTPERTEPEFQAFARLKKMIELKQGIECI